MVAHNFWFLLSSVDLHLPGLCWDLQAFRSPGLGCYTVLIFVDLCLVEVSLSWIISSVKFSALIYHTFIIYTRPHALTHVHIHTYEQYIYCFVEVHHAVYSQRLIPCHPAQYSVCTTGQSIFFKFPSSKCQTKTTISNQQPDINSTSIKNE